MVGDQDREPHQDGPGPWSTAEPDYPLSDDERDRDTWWARISPRERNAWAALSGGWTMAEAWENKKKFYKELVWFADEGRFVEAETWTAKPPLSQAQRNRRSVAIIIGAALLMAFIVGDLIASKESTVVHSKVKAGGPRPWRRPAFAEAIAHGYDHADAKAAQDSDDPDLEADERAAGAMWAASHHPTKVEDCPGGTAAFAEGCADAVHEVGRP